MATVLYYFSATGNTLSIAKDLAAELGDTALVPIVKADPHQSDSIDAIGIIFPVYCWGMPKIVAEFVDKLENASGKYIFAVCNYGGTLFTSLKSVELALARKNLKLSAGFAIKMPGNYIPMFPVRSEKKQQQMFDAAQKKIKLIASLVKNRETKPIEQVNIPVLSILTLGMNGSLMKHIGDTDKKFWITAECNGCGICANVCPVNNIKMTDEKPVWNHNCQHCLACLHWCPQKAIQFGKAPAKRGRYHNPVVKMAEIIGQK